MIPRTVSPARHETRRCVRCGEPFRAPIDTSWDLCLACDAELTPSAPDRDRRSDSAAGA